ncbi:helix-turn-helix transcriptional regulator, partial [Escherichia coli]
RPLNKTKGCLIANFATVPIKLGRSSRWLKSEVEAWLQARITQSRP